MISIMLTVIPDKGVVLEMSVSETNGQSFETVQVKMVIARAVRAFIGKGHKNDVASFLKLMAVKEEALQVCRLLAPQRDRWRIEPNAMLGNVDG